jgi:hypothetical protein
MGNTAIGSIDKIDVTFSIYDVSVKGYDGILSSDTNIHD